MPLDAEDFADLVVNAVERACAPLRERLAAAEARLAALGDVRDRVVTMEAKSHPTDDVAIVRATGPLSTRIEALEAKSMQVGNPGPPGKDGVPGRDGKDGINGIDGKEGKTGADGVPGLQGKDGLSGRDGKDGLNGLNGKDGRDGKDGQDGLGFEDISMDFDQDRTFTLTFARGTLTKSFSFVLPYLRYQGVYADGQKYASGDVVTWAGSTWTCVEPTTTKPGDGSKAWTLCVKRGRDGKDGRDAPGASPVVSIGRPQ
jgi:Collagen triple helix repeat (20 copies)